MSRATHATHTVRRKSPKAVTDHQIRTSARLAHANPIAQVAATRNGAKPSRERSQKRQKMAALPLATKGPPPSGDQAPVTRRYQRPAQERRRALLLKIGAAMLVGIVALGVIFYATHQTGTVQAGQAGQYPFAVADPAKGALAPDFTLPSTTGGTIRLSAYRGKSVLLYFQEGIGCEGCWTQLKDIQDTHSDFQSLNISAVLTITTNPLNALEQKVADEGITEPVLADDSFAVSRAYNAMAYGMMAGSADGHTFILVGPDGRIRWRADYGGSPNYTMYVPVDNLIADIKAGQNGN